MNRIPYSFPHFAYSTCRVRACGERGGLGVTLKVLALLNEDPLTDWPSTPYRS